jgi:ribosome-associated protein
MSEAVRVTATVVIPIAELRFAASRSSGPGGQHVNKTDTRVELRWDVGASAALTEAQRARIAERLAGRINRRGELVMTCSIERSQHRNRELLVERFTAVLREALARRRPRRPTAPTKGAAERRLEGKHLRSSVKRRRERPGGEEE